MLYDGSKICFTRKIANNQRKGMCMYGGGVGEEYLNIPSVL